MKEKDVIRCENRFYMIEEILQNGKFGCLCLNDGERHVLHPYECVMVKEYHKPTKSLKQSIIAFYDWWFSDKFDKFARHYFFKFVKLAFIFCAAFSVAMLLTHLFL